MCSLRWAPPRRASRAFRCGAASARMRTTMRAQVHAGIASARSTSATRRSRRRSRGATTAAGLRSRLITRPSSIPRSARVAARLTDGTPLLLDKQIGEGHMLLACLGARQLDQRSATASRCLWRLWIARRGISPAERLSGSRLVDSFVQLRCGSRTRCSGSQR